MFQVILISVFIISLLLYLIGIQNHSYWKNKGVQHVKPVPYIGSIVDCFLRKTSFTSYVTNLYWKYPDEKFVGFYEGSRAVLLVRDPGLVKTIMTTDFDSFCNRGINRHSSEVKEPLLKTVALIDGDIWRLLRGALSPAFTSSRIKAMFPLVTQNATDLQRNVKRLMEKSDIVSAKSLMSKYTIDVLGACGFGIKTDAFASDNSVFLRLAVRIYKRTKRDMVVMLCKLLSPNIFKNMYFFAPEIESMLRSLIVSVLKDRDYKRSNRNDFIDYLLELKDKGKMAYVSADKSENGKPVKLEIEMDETMMVAQAFTFFGGGYETTASSSTLTLNQLAFHPEEQKKCQREIDEVLSRHGGEITYDAVQEMKYLEMCYKESIRLIPPGGYISRACSKRYTFPGTNLTIEPGVGIVVSVQGLHTDEKYVPEPDKFIPERFLPDSKDYRKDTFMMFGIGTRSCLSERLGTMLALAAVSSVLSKYTVEPTLGSEKRPVMANDSLAVQYANGSLPLRFVPRNTRNGVSK